MKGTPFLAADWNIGFLQLKDSTFIKSDIKLKFDLMNNAIWIKAPQLGERILSSNDILSLKIALPDGHKFLFKKVAIPENSQNLHYFSIILHEGRNFTLVKDAKKVFRKANFEEKGITTVGNPYDWFEELNTYYVQKGKALFAKIDLKRGNLIELVDKSRQKEVEAFCKDKGLRGKLTPEEAVELVKFMDGLDAPK